SEKFKQTWQKLNIQPDRFIRTTDPDHKKIVEEITEKINQAGDIYKGEYEGLYCTNCETYYTENEAQNLHCPIHKKPLEKLKEEIHNFTVSKYKDFQPQQYEKAPTYTLPKAKNTQKLNTLKEEPEDLSIART